MYIPLFFNKNGAPHSTQRGCSRGALSLSNATYSALQSKLGHWKLCECASVIINAKLPDGILAASSFRQNSETCILKIDESAQDTISFAIFLRNSCESLSVGIFLQT